MTLKQKLLTALLVLLSQFAFSQIINALKLKDKKNYVEKNLFFIDTLITFSQNIRYDEPLVFDDAYSQILSFTILDTLKAKEKRELNLSTDSTIIKPLFILKTAWPSDPGVKYSITGLLRIVSWTNAKIEITFDVSVLTTKRNHIFNYNGKRSFMKSEDFNTLFSPAK